MPVALDGVAKGPQKVSEIYPELLHYTSAAGLLGILDSQSLRATHSAFLNDATEIKVFFEKRLRRVFETGLRMSLEPGSGIQVLPEIARTSDEVDAAIVKYASEMAESVGKTAEDFNQPYLFCLSVPANERIRADGLLSQWRGYGRDGGYALVFETAGLEKALSAENEAFWYQSLWMADVHYHQDENDLEQASFEIHQAEDALRRFVSNHAQNPDPKNFEELFEPVTTLSCLYKHWGFHEEREVRVVVLPPNEQLIKLGPPSGEVRSVRNIKTFLRGGTPVPYIDLFSKSSGAADSGQLPIKRVVVGPHPQSELRRAAVEKIFKAKGIDAKVEVSGIPYVGG